MTKIVFYIILIILVLVLLVILKKQGKNLIGNIKRLLSQILIIIISMIIGAIIFYIFYSAKLEPEQTVATIQFKQLAPHQYDATLIYQNGTLTNYHLNGDLFELDARILKYHLLATIFGFTTPFKLERLNSYYFNPIDQNTSNYALYKYPGQPLREIAQENKVWVDTIFGSAVIMPMVNNAKYNIYVNNSSLLARPENQQAIEAISRW